MRLAGGSYEDKMNSATTAAGAAPMANGGAAGGMTLAEVAKHNSKADCWVVVDGQATVFPPHRARQFPVRLPISVGVVTSVDISDDDQ